jgi:hypothetical protein
MGSFISVISDVFESHTLEEIDTKKVPLLHRPTSLSGTHDEMTQAVRLVEAAQRGEAKN